MTVDVDAVIERNWVAENQPGIRRVVAFGTAFLVACVEIDELVVRGLGKRPIRSSWPGPGTRFAAGEPSQGAGRTTPD